MNRRPVCDRTRLFRCQFCKKCFIGIEAFVKHKRENHGGEIKQKRQNEHKTEACTGKSNTGLNEKLATKSGTLEVILTEIQTATTELQLPSPTACSVYPSPTSLLDSSGNNWSPRESDEDYQIVPSTTDSHATKYGEVRSQDGKCSSLSSQEKGSCSRNTHPTCLGSACDRVTVKDDNDDGAIFIKVQGSEKVSEGLLGEKDDDDIQIIAIIPREEKCNTKTAFRTKRTEPLSLTTNRIDGIIYIEPETEQNVRKDVPESLPLRPVNHTVTLLREEQINEGKIGERVFEIQGAKKCIARHVFSKGSSQEDETQIQQQPTESPSSSPSEIFETSSPDEKSDSEFVIQDVYSLTEASVRDTNVWKQMPAKSPYSTGESSGGTSRISSVDSVPSSYVTSDFQPQPVQLSPVRINILPVEKSRFKYKCWSCNEAFSKRKDRSLHAKRTHGLGIPFKCNMCSEVFAQERSLIRHRVTHLQYSCTTCNRRFDGKQDFDTHMKLHESKVRKVRKRPARNMARSPQQLISEPGGIQVKVISVEEAERRVEEAEGGQDGKYPCPVCLARLSSKGSLRRHFMLHTGEKPFKCGNCKRTFTKVLHLRKHQRTIHRVVIQPPMTLAEVSDATEADISSVSSSEGSAGSPNGFKRIVHQSFGLQPARMGTPAFSESSKSSSVFKAQSDPRHHQKSRPGSLGNLEDAQLQERAQPERKPFKCKYCDKHFVRRDSRKLHENLHSGLRPYKCRVCKKGFHHPSRRIAHEKSLHSLKHKAMDKTERRAKAIGYFEPLTLPGIVIADQQKTQHEQTRLERNSPLIVTSPSTAYSETLSNHLTRASILPEVSNSISTLTTAKASESIPLQLSLQTVDSKSESNYQYEKCKICSKAVRKGSLSVHMRFHNKNKGFQCDICVKTFPNLSRLQNHAKKHSKAPFSCEICDEKFVSAGTLRIHNRRTHGHEQSRDHQCIICGKQFFTLADLKSHNAIHSRPFPCPECEKTFGMEIRLDDHIRVAHTKETPFQCSICQRRFSAQVTYLRHVSRNSCKPKATPIDILYKQTFPLTSTHQSLDRTDEMVMEDQAEPTPPPSSRENESSDAEFQEDYDESSFYFKCSICSSEFTDEELASEHTKWHRDQFRQQNS